MIASKPILYAFQMALLALAIFLFSACNTNTPSSMEPSNDSDTSSVLQETPVVEPSLPSVETNDETNNSTTVEEVATIESASADNATTGTNTVITITEPIELEGYNGKVNDVNFSSDGTQLLTAHEDGAVHIWDIDGNLQQTFIEHDDIVTSATFSPDDSYIVTTSKDKTAIIWHVQGELLHRLEGHSETIYSVTFDSDSQWFITNSREPRLWSREGILLDSLEEVHRSSNIFTIVSPNGKYIVSAGGDMMAQLWQHNDDGSITPLETLDGHSDAITHMAFTADSRVVFTSADAVRSYFIEPENNTVNLMGEPLIGRMLDSKLSTDHAMFLLDTYGDYLEIAINDGTEPQLSSLVYSDVQQYAGSFSDDGDLVVTFGATTAVVWRIGNEVELVTELKKHERPIIIAEFSPDGSHLATVSLDGAVFISPIPTK